MQKKEFKQDKGQAGLTILLSLIVMIFVIGLLIMIFQLMGTGLETSSYTRSSATVVQNETTDNFNLSGASVTLDNAGLREVTCTLLRVYNATDGDLLTVTTDYTQSNCVLNAVMGSVYNNTRLNVSYSYVYDLNNTATDVMYDTRTALGGTVDWFDIFIVIGAMMVLILLTVVIITAIRSSGMVQTSGMGGARQVGTA